VEARLGEMMELAGVANVIEVAQRHRDLRYLEVDGSWQHAGRLRFRAVEVDHVSHLRCFGYLFDLGSRTVGYSGDTRPCRGLDELAGSCETLVLECNGPHPPPVGHMDVPDVITIRERFPKVQLVLTHLGPGVIAHEIGNCIVPDDFEALEL
jgi:ribonuclease Z